MLRNKIIIKKIRNICILLMAIIIMFGVYHNIRNSKAENVIQIELDVIDKSNMLDTQTMSIEATETSEGNYLVNLPISVNKNLITKYYTSSGEEIDVDTENNIATMQLTSEEVANRKVQVQTDYDKKEVNVNDEIKLLYKKELTNEPFIDNNQDESNSNVTDTIDDTTINQDVTVTGYMPEDAKLEVKEMDLATLTNVEIPNEKQTKQKAYEISIYQIITKIKNSSTEQTDKSTYVENKDESTEGSNSETEKNETTERVEYDPSVYGEKVTVKTNYALTNVNATIYAIDEQDKTTESESTTSNDRENISFETDKTDKTIKYIIATEEINNQDDSTISNDDNSVNENTSENVNDVSKDETTESPNEIENSEWKVVESKPNIPNGTATIKVKGPEDILTEEWINVIINGESVDEGITKKIENKEKLSDGVLYTIVLTELPTDTNQIKIGLVNPYSVEVQTLAMDDDNIGNSTSDDSGIMLLATTYNALKTTTSETASTSPFLGNSSVQRQNVQRVMFDRSNMVNSIIRNYSGLNNNGNGHNASTKTWKDLTGTKNGTLNGGTWGSDYIQLDGKDDWINLGYMAFTKNVTLDVTFALSEYATEETHAQHIMVNFDEGGVGLHLYGKKPVFTISVGGEYKHVQATSDVKLNTKTRITGTYDGKNMCIYVNGKLEAKVAQTGNIDLPKNNTIMAMGGNPSGTGIQSGFTDFLKMKVYNVRINNTALTESEVSSFIQINGYFWDVSENNDKSIIAWTSSLTAPYTVHIVSASEIYANKDSTNLFSYIGWAEICTATETITYIERLNVSNTTNMTRMFLGTGHQAMTTLNLGSKFNTSSVTTMYAMFDECGYKAMTSLNLGSLFDTSKVTNMGFMFKSCGYSKMTSLSLGSNFNTGKVTNMKYMFCECGYTAMTSLNLGSKFNTSSVTTMDSMFSQCGWAAMTTLNLGSNFNTGNVTNMSKMFFQCGYAAMTSLNLGSKFNTSSVTTMYEMFEDCGYMAMTSLNLGSNFNTGNVTYMSQMFFQCGYTAMTSLDLGGNFDTSNVQSMEYMFARCGYTALTSLELGNKFNTSKVTDMSHMFNECGTTYMTELDLGPAFTKIADKNIYMFANTGKSGATIYAPESIYKNQTSFKLSSTDTSTTSGTVAVSSGRTVVPKYKPEWKVTGTTIDSTNKAIKITITGATNTSDYTSNVTTALKTSDISVWIDGTELTGVTKSLTTPSTTTASSITHTLTIKNFEESARKSGKSYKEWSGNITLKIGGRGEATSTYSKNVLKDAYGNQNMSQIDTTGTWVDVDFKDSTKSSANASGKLFADFITPEFTYEYANTTIDRGNKKVTIIFSIADKYFSSSTLTSDTTASKITVTVDGKTVTNDTTQRKKLSKTDITETIDGKANTKVGEKYTLELTNLDQGGGGDYSGIVKLAFAEGTVTDKSGNKSISKTITIGIDDPTTGDGHTSGAIVDVVSPVWKTRNLNIDKTNKKVTVDLIATDKYLTGTSNSTLTTSKIALTVDGDTNANTAITKTLSTATFSTNSSTGLKEIKYTLTLSNWEQSTKQSGKSFLEYSGTTKITIPAGTVTDQYTNKSLEQTFDLGHVDFIKPRIETVSTTRNTSAKTETIVFNVIDKYLDTSDLVTADEISVLVDKEATTGITKTLTRVTANDVKATINGTSQTVSQQYQLVLSNFEQTRTSINSARNFTDWSGTVSLEIKAGAVKDKTSGNSVNTNDKTTIDADFVDFIQPKVTYQYATGDINYNKKTFTMTFDITDKYYRTGTTITTENLSNYLTIKVDGVDITNNSKVTKKIIAIEDITAGTIAKTINKTVNGVVKTGLTNQIVGKRYTLEISDLEQAIKIADYLDYSGVITVAVKAGIMTDNGPANNGVNTNSNIATTITSGVNIPGGTGTGTVVDVVDPIWERAGTAVAEPLKQTATLVIRGTDKYFASCSLTSSQIKIVVNGEEQTSGINVELTKDTSVTLAYGVQYKVKITGFVSNAYQVKMIIPAGTLTDESGNTNKETEFLLYSCLRKTNTEISPSSPFLGNYTVERQYVEKIILQNNLDGANDTRWDVSAQEDGSIIAWYEKNNSKGTYTVYIGSYSGINANADSSYLFANIGNSSKCTETSIISNIDLLNVSSATNMISMFEAFGGNSVTNLDLGENFDTSNVTDMRYMFFKCGSNAMTSLDLGEKFNTNNVTDMECMFSATGYEAMTSLNLGENFDTSNVENMNEMFSNCGNSSMTSLNLGEKFNTSNVTNMAFMFQRTGEISMTSLNLGEQFDTSNVTNMTGMFDNCGSNSMTSLNLGNKFDTSKVTHMSYMFRNCGGKALTSLDLGDKFYTSKASDDMTRMFSWLRRRITCSIRFGTCIYNWFK